MTGSDLWLRAGWPVRCPRPCLTMSVREQKSCARACKMLRSGRLPWEAKLGASLFEATRDNLALREGREELYAELEALDLEQAGHQRELDALIAAAQEREERKRLGGSGRGGRRSRRLPVLRPAHRA